MKERSTLSLAFVVRAARRVQARAGYTRTIRHSLVVAFVAEVGCTTWLATPAAEAQAALARLSVRPANMATGTQTAGVGLQKLDSLYSGDSLLDQAYIYVPQRCVGKKRCPLGILFHGGSSTGYAALTGDEGLFRHFADSLGIIMVAPTSHSDDRGWGDMRSTEPPNVDVPRVDAILRTVLQHYAIDPKRIIAMGGSAGTSAALDLGYVNGDVFSRVIAFESFEPFTPEREFDAFTPHGKPEFYVGIGAAEGAASGMPKFVEMARKRGYSVTYVEDPGTHKMTMERGAPAFAWLTKTKGWQ